MSVDTGQTVLWILWFAQFAAVEGQALIRQDHAGTLTEHVRAWASMKGKGKWWRARRFALLALLAWLVGHLLLPSGSF